MKGFLPLSCLQSDDECCNSCEEVREAYRKKGWAITNQELIDQVHQIVIIAIYRILYGVLRTIGGNQVASHLNMQPHQERKNNMILLVNSLEVGKDAHQ